MPVFQLALKFAFGNRALKKSNFEIYKYSKQTESETLANGIIRSFRKLQGSGDANRIQLADNKKQFNLLWTLLTHKIAFRVWKEYMLIRTKFAGREGGIVSEEELNRLINKQRMEEIKFYNKKTHATTQANTTEKKLDIHLIHKLRRLQEKIQRSRFC